MIRSTLNTLYYHWRRSNWLLDPRRLVRTYAEVPIHKPIFFLGNQGGGLTLIGRMLRRHRQVVSIVGDHRHWSGPDEMQRVMELRLPKSLKLARLPYQVEAEHERLTAPRSWSYATDALLPQYRKTEADYDEAEAERFRFLIREALHRHGGGNPRKRFFDKSQVFTVKLGLLHRILADTDPHFVLITRDPYAACYRAATGKAIDMARYAAFMDLDERIALCAEHWANAMAAVLADSERVEHFTVMPFEGFLSDPKASMQALCRFLDLDFDEDLLPQPHHQIPLGTRFGDRWYPLKPAINTSYLEKTTPHQRALIAERCGPLAERLGYLPPDLG